MKNTDNKYGNYGKASLIAHDKIKNQKQTPVVAWVEAIKKINCCEKDCAKSTFLGLCEEGLIKDVKEGNYSRSVRNKKYALEAVGILKSKQITKSELTADYLWKKLISNKNINNQTKSYNQQMDVVLALWAAGLIV